MNKVKKYRQYFTPPSLADFMVNLIPTDDIKSVIDLSMGECGLLESAKKRWENASLYGADIDESLISEINKKAPYIHTYCADSLSEDITNWKEYHDIVKGNGFDLAIANPPFNFRDQAEARIGNHSQTLPIEIRFLLKYIQITKSGGYICIILPYGFLSLDLYKKLRRALLSKVYICRIIKLFDNCFKKIDANTCLVVMQKKSTENQFVQKTINIEYLDEDYSLTSFDKIPVTNSTDRLDLEYNSFLQYFPNILKTSKFPVHPIGTYVIECKRGKTLANHKDLLSTHGIRFLHTTDLRLLDIVETSATYVTNNTNYFDNSVVCSGDILIGRVGKACIGKIAVVTTAESKAVISDCIWSLKTKDIDPYYLAIFFASKYGQIQFKGIAKGSCSKYITQKDLLKISVIVPSEEKQRIFRDKYLSILKTYKVSDRDTFIKQLIADLEFFLEKR